MKHTDANSAIDALFKGSGCDSVYLDVGTNIGVQLRKLYEPHKYPGAPVLRIFDEVFGGCVAEAGPEFLLPPDFIHNYNTVQWPARPSTLRNWYKLGAGRAAEDARRISV